MNPRRHTRELATILDLGFLGRYLSEDRSTRGVLIDDTAVIYISRGLLDDMSYAPAIDDTASSK